MNDSGKRSARTASWMELVGKKGHGGSGRSPEKLRQYKSGHRGLGALDGARKNEEVHPELLDERKQQHVPAFRHFVASRENDGWRVRERRQQSKKVGKLSGMISSTKEWWRKLHRAQRGP